MTTASVAMKWHSSKCGRKQSAFSLLELTAAAAMIAVIIAASLQMLRALEGYQRRCERKQLAQQAVAAVAETVGNLPWDTLSTETAQTVRTPRSMQDRLKATTLTVRVFDENKPLVSKRIHVELIDKSNTDNLQSLAQLTCWSFPDRQPKTQ